MLNIKELLEDAGKKGCRDIHISQGMPVAVRLGDRLLPQGEIVSREDAERLISSLCTNHQEEELRRGKDLDFSLGAGGGRYRVNIYRHMSGLAASVRILNRELPGIEELGLPEEFISMTIEGKGLMLVTGYSGSGRTTALAAITDYINKNRYCHIITVEDPVEYLLRPEKATIHQREIGTSADSFSGALRSALREDADVVMLGAMKGCDIIEAAFDAAEAGHLVLAATDSPDVKSAIENIWECFPKERQQYICRRLAGVFKGCVAFQAKPCPEGKSRSKALEFLAGSEEVKRMIWENRPAGLPVKTLDKE